MNQKNQKQLGETTINEHPENALVLHLTDLNVQDNETQQITASAELELITDKADENELLKTESYQLVLSLPIPQDELQWYLTQYHIWPSHSNQEKAQKIESQLITWGTELYHSVFPNSCKPILDFWHQEKRKPYVFSVRFDQTTLEQCDTHAQRIVLSLPWQLMYTGSDYFFRRKKNPVIFRYQFPFTQSWDVQQNELPLRILLINSRPEDDIEMTDTDHRYMAKELFNSIDFFPDKVSIHQLKPPTFLELELTLDAARKSGKPYHIVHFDGHWATQPESDLVGFCFEDPEILPDTQKRKVNIVDAGQLSECMQSFEIPLVFIGICQHPSNHLSQVTIDMLQKGVASVITIPYKLNSDSIYHFFSYFYPYLMQGNPVSQAMLTGQKAMNFFMKEKDQIPVNIQDWFVPTLSQRSDPQLFHHLERIEFEFNEKQKMPELPEPPANIFVNRSQECLYIERLLENDNWAVIQAKGGVGKTALAVELAHWFTKTSRSEQIVYVKLNHTSTTTSVMLDIGDQLFSDQDFPKKEWKDYTYKILKNIFEKKTFLIFDNMEYMCPNYIDHMITNDLEVIFSVFSLLVRLLEIPETFVIFNTRQTLGEPFDLPTNVFELKPLTTNSAIQLIQASIKEDEYQLRFPPKGRPEADIERLVKTVHYHPLCLRCLAPTIHRMGINLTVRKVSTLMNKMSRHYSDPLDCALAASFELKLQKFSSTARQYLEYIAVFHECVNQMIFIQMSGEYAPILEELFKELQSEDLDEDNDALEPSNNISLSDMNWLNDSEDYFEDMSESAFNTLQDELIFHGLAWKYSDQLMLYPGLSTYIQTRLPKERYPHLRKKWARSMETFIHYINSKFSTDPSFSIHNALMDMPNIMAFLSYCLFHKSPIIVLELIDLLYPILEKIEYEKILKQTEMIRNKLNEFMDKLNDD